jgi:DNA polymerase-3 subunit epsilon
MNFTAIDFETATGKRDSACAVGIVTVENGAITEEYYSLIQPPGNEYFGMNIAVHGIHPQDTQGAPTFHDL